MNAQVATMSKDDRFCSGNMFCRARHVCEWSLFSWLCIQSAHRGEFPHIDKATHAGGTQAVPRKAEHATHKQVPGPCLNCDHQEVVRVKNPPTKIEIVLHIHKRVGMFQVSRRTEITNMSRPAACRFRPADTAGGRDYRTIGTEASVPFSSDVKMSWILWAVSTN